MVEMCRATSKLVDAASWIKAGWVAVGLDVNVFFSAQSVAQES